MAGIRIPFPRALRNGAFARLLLSTLISNFGSSMTFIALPLVAYDRSGDGHAFALVMLGGSLGRLVALPIGGVVADRFDRLRVLILGEASLLIIVGAIAATVRAEWWVGVALAQLTLNLAASLVQPAGPALRNDIVADSDREQSNSLMSLVNSIGFLLGPVCGAAIYALWGFTAIVVIDAASYAAAMLLLIGLRGRIAIRERTDISESNGTGIIAMLRTTGADVRIASQASRRDPFIMAVLGGSIALGATNGFLITSLVPWLVETLGAPSALVGPALATVGVSGIVSGVLLTAYSDRVDQSILLRFMAVVFVAAALPLFFRIPIPLVFVVFGAIGIAEVAVNTSITTFTQRRVPASMQGRIMSFMQLCFVMSNVVAIAVCGALIGIISAQALMGISAVMWLLYAPFLWAAAVHTKQPAPLMAVETAGPIGIETADADLATSG